MSSPSRRHKQLIIGGMICAVGFGAMYVVSQTLDRSTPGVPTSRAESGVTTTMIADRTRAAAPEMSWIKDAATELDDLRDKYVNLETSVQTMVELHEAEKARTAAEYDEILLRYEETINALQQRLEAGQGGVHRKGSGGAPLAAIWCPIFFRLVLRAPRFMPLWGRKVSLAMALMVAYRSKPDQVAEWYLPAPLPRSNRSRSPANSR